MDRVKKAAYDKRWCEKNKEHVIAYHKAYDKQHKVDNEERKKQWYSNHREELVEYNRQYHSDNREEIIVKAKLYYKANKVKLIARSKQYYLENREKCLANNKLYRDTHKEERITYNKQHYLTDEGKITRRRANHKRRVLGFFPINKPFDGCHAHHISKNFVIYIPEELHRCLHHSIWTWKNMEQMNKLAMGYL